MRYSAVGHIAFTSFILVVITWSMAVAYGFPYEARLLPMALGVPAALLCLVVLVQDILRLLRPADTDAEAPSQIVDIQTDLDMPLSTLAMRAAVLFGWIFVLFVGTWLFGFLISIPGFIFLYLAIQGRERVWVAATASLTMLLFAVLIFHFFLRVAWLRGYFPTPQATLIDWLNQLYRMF